MSDDHPRLIEHAFPLKQASLDSVHEKNVRHGHISTLHIWPARRPLAACRAALIATLLPDPGNAEERKKLLEKLGGKIVRVVKRKKMPSGKVEEKIVEETVGGILHWGRESSPDLDWFREEIREAYGGRVPKVLDPFAGGGAIPLEAIKGATLKRHLAKLGFNDDAGEIEPALIDHDPILEADLAWQVRAWGRWVLSEARKRLAHLYPTYAEFQALKA